MKDLKRNFLFLFYLLSGIIFGSFIASVCRNIPGLAWLGYSNTIGFSASNPAVLDLIVFKVTLGFAMSVSIAQIFTISLAMFLYNRSR